MITNALKFAPAYSQVEIKSEYQLDGKLSISVKDSGKGFTKEEAEHLFRPYGKIESGRSMNPNGIGLGLYISKHICE